MTNREAYDPPKDCVEAWIKAISDCIGVAIRCTDYVFSMLVRRANYLRLKSRKFKGGVQRKRFFETEWQFKVPVSDVVTIDTLRSENAQLKKKVEDLTSELKLSSTQLKRLSNEKQGRGRSRKYTQIDDYSTRQKARIKKQRTESCIASLRWMQDEGYKPLRIIALNPQNQEEEITLHQHMEYAINEQLQKEDVDMLSMMVYVKDRFSVSGSAYHEMARVCKKMPRHYKLKQKIAELNTMWDIKPTPNGVLGVQQSLEPQLRKRVKSLCENTPSDAPFKTNGKLRVKLSGDSTNMGKRIQVENFTYTLLDEGERAYGYEACHPLAIFRAPEKYDTLKLALQDIIEEVSALKTLMIDGKKYAIEYFLGGDWKFLALVTGKNLIVMYCIHCV